MSDTVLFAPADRRALVLPGLPADKTYTFEVRAYRKVDADLALGGVILSPAITSAAYKPANSIAFNGDVTGTIHGRGAIQIVLNLENIASDSVLSTTEKLGLIQYYNLLSSQLTSLLAKATEISGLDSYKTAASNAKSALDAYLNGLTPAWNDSTQHTNIVKTTFRQKFNNLNVALADLTAAVSGQPGPTLAIIPSAQGFTYVNGALSPSAQTITMTAQVKGVNTPVNWSTTPNIKSASNTAIFSISSTEMGSNRQVVVTATYNGNIKQTFAITKQADAAATKGAPDGTPVGDRTAEEVTGQLDNNAVSIADLETEAVQARTDIDDLFTTYGSTAAAADSADIAQAAAQIAENARDASSGFAGEAETSKIQAGQFAADAANEKTEAVAAKEGAEAAEAGASTQAILSATARLETERAQRQIYNGKAADDYWVNGYFHSKANLPDVAARTVAGGDVFPVTVPGIGEVAQGNNYQLASERSTRPFVDGQKMRFRMRTRVLTDATNTHRHYLFIAVNKADGSHGGVMTLATFSGLTVADGWQVVEYTVDPAALKAAGSGLNGGTWAEAVEWRFMWSFNTGTASTQATQQVDVIDITDVTGQVASEDAAAASAASASVAQSKATEAGTYANAAQTDRVAAQTARSGAEAAESLSVIARDESQGAASAAKSYSVLSASLASGSLGKNGTFADYTPESGNYSVPPDWFSWIGGGNRTFGNGDQVTDGPSIEGSPWGFYQETLSNDGLATYGNYLAGIYQETPASAGKYVFRATVQIRKGAGLSGAGIFVLCYDASGNTIDNHIIPFSSTPDIAGRVLGAGIAPGVEVFRFAKMLDLAGSVAKVRVYAMTNWDGFGDALSAKGMSWLRCSYIPASDAEAKTGLIDDLSASVTVNSSAIGSIEDTAAFLEQIAEASGGNPAIFRMLAGKYGATMTLVGDRVLVMNYITGELVEVARFEGGVARLNQALIRDLSVAPTPVSSIYHKVQLQPIILTGGDGAVLQYQDGATYGGGLPRIEPTVTGLPALSAGESYDIRATNITDSQFTARVKKLVAGGPAAQSSGAFSDAGGGATPRYQADKPTAAEAYDGSYQFTFTAILPKTSEFQEAPPTYTAEYRGEFDLYGKSAGGVWTKIGSTTGLSSSFSNYSGLPNSVTRVVTANVTTSLDMGTGAAQFGVHPTTAATYVTPGAGKVEYSTQTASSETAVSGLIKWTVYPPS